MAARKGRERLAGAGGGRDQGIPAGLDEGHARCCGSVGSRKRDSNQRSMAGWKPDNDILKYGEDLPKERHPRDAAMRSTVSPILCSASTHRGDAHRQGSGAQPPGRHLLPFGPHRAEPDGSNLRIDAARVFNVIGRRPLMTDGGEVGRVARVVSPITIIRSSGSAISFNTAS